MRQIDLSKIPVRDANELMRELGEAGQNIEVLNPDARHHIGVGLTAPITVKVRGSAGYFCAGLTDGARFEVDNNVGWGLADNIYSGTVVVGGNAGAIAGVAIRGAEVIVKGNIGSRSGQVMKAGTLLCCGNANFMAGYMMYGGRIIILGNSGERVGEDMSAGDIDVDGLDPTACPGTGYPEPGGLTMREVQQILRGCRGLNLLGADVCEVSPGFDPSGGTALVGAHLLFEELCILAESVAKRKGRV